MISIYKNNDLDVKFQIKDQDQKPIDLTGALIKFAVKVATGDSKKIIYKDNNDTAEITIDETDTSICTIYLVPDDTKELVPKEYWFELLIELPKTSGDGYSRYTAVVDKFEVLDTVISS